MASHARRAYSSDESDRLFRVMRGRLVLDEPE